MSKEQIKLTASEVRDVVWEESVWDSEDNIVYDQVHNEVVYTDLEKGYEKRLVVFKRVSDGKLFKAEILDSPHVGFDDTVFTETKRLEQIKVVYKYE